MILDFDKMENGEVQTGTVFLETYKMTTKKADGSEYVSLVIMDGNKKKITASWFDGTCQKMRDAGFEDNAIITITLQKNSPYYNVKFLRNGHDENPEDLMCFQQKAPIDVPAAYNEILATVRTSVTPGVEHTYAQVTEYILTKYQAEFKHSSAAKSNHHNYLGGLVHHTLGMVRVARNMDKVYPFIDKELLVCGASLHDIGKIQEYITTDFGTATFSVNGILSGHLFLGAEMIRDAYQELGIENEVEMRILMHMIQSHHGEPEYDAIKKPAFPEAYMLYAIDLIDSRMAMYLKDYEDMESGTVQQGQKSYVYKIDTAK